MNVLEVKKFLEENNAYVVSSNNGKKWCVGKCDGIGLDSNGNAYIIANIDHDTNIECGNAEDDYYTKLGRVLKKLDN